MSNSSNSFNPQWLGYTAASDKQIINGSAPFVYNYMQHDSQTCITAKSLFNTAHSAMYAPNSIVPNHPASSNIQSSTMKLHEATIQNECTPSFRVDSNYFGLPSPSFS